MKEFLERLVAAHNCNLDDIKKVVERRLQHTFAKESLDSDILNHAFHIQRVRDLSDKEISELIIKQLLDRNKQLMHMVMKLEREKV